jgi:hypothetical protein
VWRPVSFLAFAAYAVAQSHPSWWTYASPGATALVGIEWQTVRASPFADPIDAELWGDLGFPELPSLRSARQILISSPDLLALASGNFPAGVLRDEAIRKSMKAMKYRGLDLYFATEKGALSIARMSDQLVMLGTPKTLQSAIDRSLDESRNYSPLLAKAAKFNGKDLWIVAAQLPDELAARFVPLEMEARGFEGSVALRNGLSLEATLSAGTEDAAKSTAEKLATEIPGFPAIARNLKVSVEEDCVALSMTATRDQVMASLRGSEPAPKPVETVRVETPKAVEKVVVEAPPLPKREPPKVGAQKAPVLPAPPVEKPMIIRIIGLDEGPKEIILPPVKREP